MHFAILLLVFLLYAVLAWRDIRVALVLLAGLLPIYLLRFSILGLPTTALEVLILICVAVWLIKHKGGKVRPRDFGPWFRPMLLLLAASTISTAIAPHLYDALGIWKAYFIEPVLVFVMLRDLFEKSDWMRAMKALAISGIIVSCFAIFQYYTGLGIPTPWDIELRVTGFFDYPNALGLFLAPIISACAVLLTSPIPKGRLRGVMAREGWGVVIAIITALLGSIAIILAQTEAAFVAIPVALILTLMFSSAGTKTKKRVALEALAIIILLTLAVPSVRSKIFLQDYSGQVRISQWSETVTMLADNPKYLLLGTGLNSYPEALEPYHNPTLIEIFQYPHNIILNIWTELGLLGLIAFVWLAITVIKEIRSSIAGSEESGITSALQLAAFTALATMLIHGLVDVPYFKNDLAVMTFIFLAIISAKKKS